MRHRGIGACLRILTASLVLGLSAVLAAGAGEWEDMQERYDSKLRALARQLADIEARERREAEDPERRMERITKDRIAASKASLKGGGKTKGLADTAERPAGDARALVDVYAEQREYLGTVTSEWAAQGTERRKLRDDLAASPPRLEQATESLTRATAVAEALPTRMQTEALERIARIETEAKDAADRLRARWQREQAAREREREQREREAAERARAVR
jgi:hypothetical protein